MPRFDRPAPDEHLPYYAGYISQVPDGDLLTLLDRQCAETVGFLRGLPRARWTYRYARGKWSVAEVVGHVCDTERIFAYRALRFARGDATPLAGFEQDDYVPVGKFDAREPGRLIEEFEAVRRATIALLRDLPDDAPQRRGVANNAEISVRALAFIIAGHERHHLRVLRERYV
jgi:hypothetical protein